MSRKLKNLSPEVFAQAFAQTPLPCLLVSVDGEIHTSNDAFSQLIFVAGGHSQKTRLHDFVEPLPADLSSLVNVQTTVTFRVGKNSGSLTQLQLIALEPPGTFYLASFSNHQTRSYQQEKLETLGVLAGSVAHDLNNVLTSILGHVSFLRLSMADGRTIGDSVLALEDGARRAASITQKILDFAKGQESSFSPLALEELVSSSLRFLRASIPDNIKLTLDVQDPDVWVLGDKNQLEQVFMNLTLNARDALASGGEIIVSLDSYTVTQGMESPDAQLEPGNYAVVHVRDTGHGIPSELVPRIFEPFFTTKKKGGTGLGLAIVSSIVKVHGGKISVSSDERTGTCFSIYFPRCLGVENSLSGERNTIPQGHERILVVDDEDAVRTIVQRSLEHLGYEVLVARNGTEALMSFARDPKGIQLVIIDMIMPNMAGDELFEQLQAIDPGVPVLVASGYSSDKRTRSILDRGGLGFIQKPFAVEELAREVRRCLDVVAKRTL